MEDTILKLRTVSIRLKKIDLTTSKKNSINHGYGIQSINQLVKRNNAVINFIQSRNSFSSIVILPI